MPDQISDASAAALASLTADPAPVADATPAPVTDSQTPPAADNSAPVPGADPAPTATYKVKVGGQEVEVALDELMNGYSRQSDYTRKAMQLAEERKALEATKATLEADTLKKYQEKEAQYQSLLRNADQVAAWYQHLTGQTLPQGQQPLAQDPMAPVTLGQTEQMLKAAQEQIQSQMQQVQQFTQQELGKLQQAEQAKQAAALDTEISSTINGILADPQFSVLNAVDDVSEILCADAMKLLADKPQPTFAEAKAAFVQAAQARTERLQSHFAELKKQAAVQQQKLKSGIEPPGGSGVTPQPTNHKLGSKDLTNSAIEFVKSLGQK